ncbi:MAG: gliding motility-associated C-terminal domain-containing protein [Bacteroidota bacterium]
MKNFSVIAMLLLLSGSILNAQTPNRCSYIPPRQADNWLFYQNALLNFDDNGQTLNNQLNSILGSGSASVSDAQGTLVLYTNGFRVFNGNYEDITYGPNIEGVGDKSQMALVVPNIAHANIYYIFTADGFNSAVNSGFNVTRVDMAYNDNRGWVTDLNLPVLDRAASMLTGVVAGDSSGYWVLTHGVDNSNIYSYKVDEAGVDTLNPVISSVSKILNGDPDLEEDFGALKVSPKGDKLVMVSYGKSVIELFHFDDMTGRATPWISLTPQYIAADNGPTMAQFSPDGSKLYINIFGKSSYLGRLYQYDLSLPDALIDASVTWLNEPAPGDLQEKISGMQLARDGMIYVINNISKTLNVIQNPNRPGFACNYRKDIVPVNKSMRLGLPNFIESFFNLPPVDYDTRCDGDATVFDILNKSNIDQVTWDFGDAGNPTPGSGLNPVHTFSTHGSFDVRMTETFGGQDFETIFPVHIDSLPSKSFIPDSLYIFPGSTIPLDAGADMFSYLWQDGGAGRFFEVSDPGLYTVEYVDINCCRNADSLNVIALDIMLPNAFTPDSDNLNDVFRALGPTDGIEDFTLAVYNRFGQMIWEADSFSDAWDGTFNGQQLPTGVYAWNMTFNVKGNVMEIGKVKYRGFVTLLR